MNGVESFEHYDRIGQAPVGTLLIVRWPVDKQPDMQQGTVLRIERDSAVDCGRLVLVDTPQGAKIGRLWPNDYRCVEIVEGGGQGQ